jgi:hypothetical protein
MVSETVTGIDCAGFPESVAANVSVTVPGAVMTGVPEITPVPVLSNSPCGRVPAMSDQAYGPVPPLACKVTLYGEPAWAAGSTLVVTANGAGSPLTVVPTRPQPWSNSDANTIATAAARRTPD